MSRDSGWGSLVVVILVGTALYQCVKPRQTALDYPVEGPSDTYRASTDHWGSNSQMIGGDDDIDQQERREEAFADMAGSTYTGEGAPYGCTQDCSGHDAGWQWAADNYVTDPYGCGGNSQSFIEGCQAFAEAVEQRTEDLGG